MKVPKSSSLFCSTPIHQFPSSTLSHYDIFLISPFPTSIVVFLLVVIYEAQFLGEEKALYLPLPCFSVSFFHFFGPFFFRGYCYYPSLSLIHLIQQ